MYSLILTIEPVKRIEDNDNMTEFRSLKCAPCAVRQSSVGDDLIETAIMNKKAVL